MGYCRLLGGKIWNEIKFVQNNEKIIKINENDDITFVLHENDLITPGLIDFHCHLWSPATISPFGVDEGKMYAEGIVAGIDAGSFGCDNWEVADRYWGNDCKMKIKSFMSILPEGLAIFPPIHPTRPEDVNIEDIVKCIKKNNAGGRILGTKVQLGWLNYKDIATDRKLMQIAKEVADRTDTNIMVHISGQCIDIKETVSFLKAGDIITHIYSGFDNTIMKNGKVSPVIHEAQRRGVIFDVGHAGKHFSWEVFKSAYDEGIYFDTIGGDIIAMSWKNTSNYKIYDLFHLLSGFLNYGVDLDEVFRAAIFNPGRYMGIKMDIDENCLVLARKASDSVLTDGAGGSVHCNYEYKPSLFINNGKVILKES